MNDLAAVEGDVGGKVTRDKVAGRASLVASLVKPTLGAVAPACRANPRGTSQSDTSETVSTDALILERLQIAAPALVERANAATRSRFTTLVSKRLCGGISIAVKNVLSEIGAVAVSLEPDEGRLLQDLALTVRYRTEILLPQAVMSMTPTQLVAVLADACNAHAPGGLDWLRCREVVYGRGNLQAREAMLDLASSGTPHATVKVLDRIVASSLIEMFAAGGALAGSTIGRLRERFIDANGSRLVTTWTSARTRLDGDPSPRDILITAISAAAASVPALLASAAHLSLEAVQAAICLRSPKGLASIAWRAGLDATVSVTIQSVMGRVPPDEVLHPTETGCYPLTEAEMLWQCRLFARTDCIITVD